MTPAGEVVETLRLPARNVTACCLGGPELRTLYVTTGVSGDGAASDGGGSLFALDVAVPGLPEPVFAPRPR